MSPDLRLSRLTLHEFRGIRSATLDLSSDVILIYGRNGVGKTTVFDAIEYALFGSVRRLARLDSAGWTSWLPNVYSRNGFGVALRLNDGSTYPEIINGAAVDGSSALADTSVGSAKDRARRSSPFTRQELQHLMLATHLFSQSHLLDLEGESSLDTKSLAGLVGLGYLHDYWAKLAKIEEELEVRQSRSVQEAQALQRQLDAVNSMTRGPGRRQELSSRVTAIAESARVGIRSGEEPAKMVEDLSEAIRQQIANLHRRAAELETMLLGPSEPVDLLESTKKRYDSLKQRRDALFEEREKLGARRLDLDNEFATADESYRSTSELTEILYRYQTDKVMEAQRSAEVHAVDSRLASDLEVISTLTNDFEQLTAEIQQQNEALTERREHHALLSARQQLLRESLYSLEKAQAELARARAEGDLASRGDGAEALDQALVVLEMAHGQLRGESGDVHPRCPLCHSSFTTHEALSVSIAKAREIRTRGRLAITTPADGGLQSTTASGAATPAAAKQRIREAELAVDQELARLSAYMAPTETLDTVLYEVAGSLSSVGDEISKKEAAQAGLTAKIGLLSRKRARIEAQVDDNRRVRASLEAALTDIRRALMHSAEKLGIANPPVDLEERMLAQTRSLADASRWREDISNAQRVLLEDEALIMRESAAVESASISMEVALNEIQNSVQQRGDRLRALGIDPATPATELRKAKAETRVRLDSLHVFLDELSEITIDFARSRDDIADASATRHETIVELEIQAGHLASVEAAIERVRNWRARFKSRTDAGIRLFLEPAQKSINAWFAALVPDAARFNGIAIDQLSPRLALGLRFRDVPDSSGKPDYFLSAAQLSVLAASIFLTFAEKQQWSRLDVAMLDDPVQNLDNLDSLALIDGLREFVRVTGKQLIVSTCDRQLYQLMIQKFDRKWRGPARSVSAIRLEYDVTRGVRFHYDVGRPQLRLSNLT